MAETDRPQRQPVVGASTIQPTEERDLSRTVATVVPEDFLIVQLTKEAGFNRDHRELRARFSL